MAFKSDWTPGIMRYIAPLAIIVLFALGLGNFFDKFPKWLSVFLLSFCALLILLGIVALVYKYMRRHEDKKKEHSKCDD